MENMSISTGKESVISSFSFFGELFFIYFSENKTKKPKQRWTDS